ncbi:ZNF782 [Branchiostoma lanceolatum]|uniref:ZNF782 protein n=1 Tax=Branchiostoma lanceolatum TaxID=7740 RepID=A0A8K0EYU7_BRALA|nr:ZNF782 [Branchiostoma lanceolatum]
MSQSKRVRVRSAVCARPWRRSAPVPSVRGRRLEPGGEPARTPSKTSGTFSTATVTTRKQALQCDRCDGWQHRTCDTGIWKDFYRRLCSDEVRIAELLCSRCLPTEEDAPHPTGEETQVTEDGANDEVTELSETSQSPIPIPRVVQKDSIGYLGVEEDIPVGADRDVTFTFIDKGTKRGGDLLTDSFGYAYTVKRKRTNVRYWVCQKRPTGERCPASLIERDGGYKRGDNNHDHPPVVNCETNIKIQAEVRKKALADVSKSAHTIVKETMLANVDETAPNPELPRISNLIRMANRNREKLRPYRCDECTMQFKELSHLKRHMRTHTEEKPYKCEACSKQFGKLCSLKAHMRTHMGKKPYSCEQCNKLSSELSSLKRRMRTQPAIRSSWKAEPKKKRSRTSLEKVQQAWINSTE